MKLHRYLVTAGFALACLVAPAFAETLLPTNDTYSTLYFNTAHPPVLIKSLIASATGASPYLVVSRLHHSFINFDAATKLTGEGLTATDIAAAKLTVYFPIVSKSGAVDLHLVTSSWSETFTGPPLAEPSYDSADTIGSVTAVAKQFATFDVTTTVKAWLNGAADNGFALDSADPLVVAVLGAKEGPGSGYPATLEIEVNSTPSLFQASNGNVGIGTTSPQLPLEVAVSQSPVMTGSGDATSSLTLQITNSDQTGTTASPDVAGLAFGSSNSMRQGIVGGTFGNDFLEFFTAGDFTHSRLYLDGLGNVGIGTTTPQAPLDVEVHGGSTGTNQLIAKFGRNDIPEIEFNDELLTFGLTTGATMTFNSTAVAQIKGGGNIALMPTGAVGIGTTAPVTALHVHGAITSSVAIGTGLIADDGTTQLSLGFGASHAGLVNNSNGSVNLATNFTTRLTAATNGNVGVGTTTPGASLDVHHLVSGTAFEAGFVINKELIGIGTRPVIVVRTFDNTGIFNFELNEGNAFKPGGGSWGVVSDRRLKKDIEPLAGALEHLLQLRSVTYQYIDPVKSHQLPGTQIGFIAQEVDDVFPEWVTVNSEGYKTVTIRGFESLTVQALRELRAEKDAQIQKLTADNAALTERVTALEAQNKAREARLTRLEQALDAQPARATTAVLELK